MDYFDSIKNSLENAKNIVIVTNRDAGKDIYASALGVFFALKDKYNIFLPKDKNPEKLIKFLDNETNKKKIIISLKNGISEISYERKNGNVDLCLIPRDGESIKPENFSCKIVSEEKENYLSSPGFFDLIVAFNIKSFNELETYFKESPDSIYNCSIINIDNDPQNENYGEINVIEEKKSLSEEISNILKVIQKNINEKSAGFLLWGILSLISSKKDKKTFSTIKWLINQGANMYFHNIDSLTKKRFSLLEKTIKNAELSENDNIYVSTLFEKDFKETGCTSSDLSFIIEKMKNYFSIPSFVLLWEGKSSPVSIKGVFYSDKKYLIDAIKQVYNGSYKGKGGIFLLKNMDLPSAEKEITSLLWKK
ncbi:MAG: hypothetical protein MCSN_5170 [Candidatus Microsyncoccus archaeolyticus]|nr:MAG: hypothetical protein MCSN_5170 [Candidatus Parcubacteria bacterium]